MHRLTAAESAANWPEPPPSCAPCRRTLAEARAQRRKLLPDLIATAQVVSGLKRHTSAGMLTGLRLRFQYREGLVATLTELAETEQAACSILKFKISMPPQGGMITLEMTGPEGTREMLLNLAGSD